MQCDRFGQSLSPYVDDALPSDERNAVQHHLFECAACRARLDALRAVKHAIARLPSSEEPPGAVRARVESLRFEPPGCRAWRGTAVAAAAALALVVALSLMRGRDGAVQLAEDLVVDHLHSVPEVKPAEVASSDRAEVARFFVDHLPFDPVVPELPGTKLLGARLCQLKGRRVELLFYHRENRTLSMFVTDRPVADAGCWATRGHHVCSRSQAGLTMLLVGELSADELRRLLSESSF